VASGVLPNSGEIVTLNVEIGLSKYIPIHVTSDSKEDVAVEEMLEVRHLPPLHVSIELPPTYPIECGPIIHEIKPEHDWLPLSIIPRLMQMLMDMWSESLVLDLWIDYLQNGEELLSALKLLELQPQIIR